MSEDLANLSNEEIRARLLEYGLPNTPVTQTTRKLLIKRLSNAMELKKSIGRRETVAVIKSSDEEDIEEIKRTSKREKTPNRRATIGVVEKTKKVIATSTSNGTNSRAETPSKTTTSTVSSRRSSRATPQKVVSSSAVAALQVDSDDNDVIEIPIIRRSKTPTIAKSETVRTSYKSIVEKFPEEMSQDDEVEEPPRSQRSSSRRKTLTMPEVIEKPSIRTATPTKFGRSTLTTSYNPSGTYNFSQPTKVDHEIEEEEDFEILDNAPYLSNFAKRLSTLKAEPIDSGLGKYKSLHSDDDYNSKKYETTSYRFSQYGSKYQPQNRGVVNQMARGFDKLDRKYSIRKYILIALVIMVLIAIYVLLFA